MLDSLIVELDKALRTLFSTAPTSRNVPGERNPAAALSADERSHSGALMRINHVGEVCAQALYQGQAIFCHDPEVRQVLAKAAYEETEHLSWTERRISELGARKSLLNPVWYIGALSLGLFASKCGDAWSLGFLAETERQVELHLGDHLSELPAQDTKSRAIVRQMKIDEALHADIAVSLGARNLPSCVIVWMRFAARVMTRTAYYL